MFGQVAILLKSKLERLIPAKLSRMIDAGGILHTEVLEGYHPVARHISLC